MKNIYSILVLLNLLNYSCKNYNPDENIPLVEYNTVIYESEGTLINDEHQVMSILDSVHYIKLETTSESLIKEIRQLLIINDTIVIFDRGNNNILTFTKEGNFINRIGKVGRGPAEYNRISSFSVDNNQQHIILIDESLSKCFRYRLDGKFSREDYAPQTFATYHAYHNNHYYYYKNNDPYFENRSLYYNIITYDNERKNVVNQFIRFKEEDVENNWYMVKYPFYILNDTLHYIDKWNNRIFQFSENKLLPKLKIDFGNKELPVKYQNTESDFFMHKDLFFYLNSYIFETADHIWFSYSRENESYWGLFFKKDNNLILLNSSEGFPGNIEIGLFKPISTYKESFLIVINMQTIYPLKGQDIIKNIQLNNILDNSTIADNPVLGYYSFKK